MLQLNYIRNNFKHAEDGLKKRGLPNPAEELDKIIGLDDRRKETQTALDAILAESNSLSKEIGLLMKEGKRDEAQLIKDKTAILKSDSKKLGEQLVAAENQLMEALYQLPNIPHVDVPEGKTPEENLEIEKFGSIPELDEYALPHWELIKKYDIVDFDLGIKVTGAGFPIYKGKGARLQRALTSFFLDEAAKAGYLEVQPPLLVNKSSGLATGQLPDKEGQMYELENGELFLIPTAEVPITNMYRDQIIEKHDLPIKNCGYSLCFRREAGSWGAHVRGLNRLHQFDKVELVRLELPDRSYQALEEMNEHVKHLLKQLELPFRILLLCGGDLGFTSAKTFDFEVFSAAQKKWLEVSSVSNFETYQANRLKLRFRNEDRKIKLLHTLNGSALAFPRILAALLENNQKKEGIKIPDILVPYTGFEWIN